jgi:hypothetical protein
MTERAIEIKLKPGWLLRDVQRASARVKEWEAERRKLASIRDGESTEGSKK